MLFDTTHTVQVKTNSLSSNHCCCHTSTNVNRVNNILLLYIKDNILLLHIRVYLSKAFERHLQSFTQGSAVYRTLCDDYSIIMLCYSLLLSSDRGLRQAEISAPIKYRSQDSYSVTLTVCRSKTSKI